MLLLLLSGMTVYIGDAARMSGLTIDTIRYYESLGLITDSTRDGVGRRVFTADDLLWLVFLRRMRETNMPIVQLQEYLRCRGRGVDGIAGILRVLKDHHHAMGQQQAALNECIALIEAKIAKYEGLAAAGLPPGTPEVDLE